VLTVEPTIIERFVRTGRVKLVFRDVLNHAERSDRASEAAACAGRQGYFWHMHELLFTDQAIIWQTQNADLLPLMLGFGERIEGLDQAAYRQCLQDRLTLPALEAADAEQRARGITIQPIFEIGDQRIVGVQAVEVFEAAIVAAE
jgi:protein-disulfide isomerase